MYLLVPVPNVKSDVAYLNGSSEAENTIVTLLLRKSLQRQKDNLVLLRDQIIGSAIRFLLANGPDGSNCLFLDL